MKTVIYINNEGISFERNWFTGSFTYTKDGITKNLDSILNFSTHFSTKLSKKYKVIEENNTIEILKTRPMFFGGITPHNYKFFIDETLVKELNSF